MPRLRLYLLGPAVVEQDGKPLTVDTRKAIALLAYLAITGKSQRRDQLIGFLWPDADAAHAFAVLRRTLSVLRSALAGDWLRVDRETIALPPHPDVWCDVAEFHNLLAERVGHGHAQAAVCPACLPLLTRATALHRGDFMSNFGLRDSPDFDDWQMQQAEELRNALSQTLDLLVQGLIAQGDLEAALAQARRWLALDRLNEAAHAQLMRILAWSGQRAAALQQYQACDRILQEQLGVLPQNALVALHEAIRGANLPRPPALAASRAAALVASPLETPAEPAPAVVVQERRVVTVVAAHADLGTQRASESDAQRVAQLGRALADIVRRQGGHSARISGGSILAVFGAARRRESDAELAVRAALEMQDEAATLGLGLRVGVSTGEVYIGGDAPDGQAGGLVGRAIDQALRLALLAAPGEALATEPTYRASRGAFVYRRAEAPGLSPLTVVYRVEQLLAQPAKARGLDDMRAPLIGRDDELARLQAAFGRAGQGQGQMVSVIGEAGVGKSRLVAELRERVQAGGGPLLWLEGRCLDMSGPAGYAPFLDILRGYLGQSAESDESARRHAIVSRLQGLVDVGHLAPARAGEIGAIWRHLLGIAGDDPADRALQNEPAEQMRWRTFQALRDLILAIAKQQPLVLVFEDLHWADELSIDLLRVLMQGLSQAALLLICSYRSERDSASRDLATVADQTCRDAYAELRLRELTEQESQRLVDALLATDAARVLPQDVIRRAQGNPFFIEEIVRSLIDAGALYRQGQEWRMAGDGAPGVPESVESVILSRVDRLDAEDRRVLQAAAVIGRAFRQRVLEDVCGRPAGLGDILDELAARALIYQEQTFPEVAYSFKHVLTQQAVYQAMLTGQRAAIHRRVATAVETLYPDSLADSCEQLAHHHEQGGDAEKAVEYLVKAGETATRRHANASAIAHLTRALDLLRTLPESSERDQREINLLLALGGPLTASQGYASEELEKMYNRARELAQRLGDMAQLFPALHGLWRLHLNRVDLPVAHELARELMHLAQTTQDPGLLVEAHRALTLTFHEQGDLSNALAQAEQGMALYTSGEHSGHSSIYGQDPVISLLGYAAYDLWLLGYPDQALQKARRLVAAGQESANPYNRAFALLLAGRVHIWRGDMNVAEEQTRTVIAIATQHNYQWMLGHGLLMHGWAIRWRGRGSEGITEIERGLAILRTLPSTAFSYGLVFLAEAYGDAGRLPEALATLDEASCAKGFDELRAYRYWLNGDLLQKLARAAEAEERFQHAIEIARDQSAKSLELQAAKSLARLWQQRGKRDEARALLQRVYNSFSEGFDTPPLQEARALLAELA